MLLLKEIVFGLLVCAIVYTLYKEFQQEQPFWNADFPS